jgi:hypothetical protein
MDRGNTTLLKNPARYLAVVGLSILFLQSLAALWYYDLRMYFVDAPFMVFRIIQLDSLSLQVGRFGAFITQFFPYIMQKTGFSLENILRGYSVAFSLFPLVVAWILFRMQQYPWVSLLALYFTMFCTDAWFWPNNEIHQGVVWMTLGMGIWFMQRERLNDTLKTASALVLIFVAVFCHPLMIPLMIFVQGFFILRKDLNVQEKRDRIFLIGTVFIIVMKWYASKHNWYDSTKLTTLSDTSLERYLHFYQSESFRGFAEMLFKDHLQIWVIVLVWIVFVINSKKYRLFIWSCLGISIHIVMTSVLMDRFYLFYAQSQWMILSYFVAMPLMFAREKFINSKVIPYLAFFYMLIWVHNIGKAQDKFEERLYFLDKILNAMEEKNLNAVALVGVPPEYLQKVIMDWGLPVESLLRSSAAGKPKSFYFSSDEENLPTLGVFRSCFDSIPADSLNTFYFRGYRPEYVRTGFGQFIPFSDSQ